MSRLRRFAPTRRVVGTLAVAGVLAVPAVLLVGKVASYASLVDAVRDADWRWVVVCVAGEVLAYTGYILAYRDLARVDGGPTLSYRLITRIVATSFGAFVLSSV